MKITELLSSSDKFLRELNAARNHNGQYVGADNSYAVAWSLWGALIRCGGNLGGIEYKRLVLAMPPAERDTSMNLTRFGCNHTYEEVIQLAKDAGV